MVRLALEKRRVALQCRRRVGALRLNPPVCRLQDEQRRKKPAKHVCQSRRNNSAKTVEAALSLLSCVLHSRQAIMMACRSKYWAFSKLNAGNMGLKLRLRVRPRLLLDLVAGR